MASDDDGGDDNNCPAAVPIVQCVELLGIVADLLCGDDGGGAYDGSGGFA